MQSRKIEQTDIPQGGDMAQIAMAVAAQQQKNMTALNKDLLPSKGKFYKNDLYVKKMSTIDIKNLSTLNLETLDGIINSIIAHNVQGINVNDILVGDKYWLLFYLRNLTYNDYPFYVKYHCTVCDKMGTIKTTMDDFIVNYIKDDFNPRYTMDNGDEIEIGFPTIGNEVSMKQILNEPEKYSIGDIDDKMLNVACYIKTINGSKVSLMKSYDYICNLDAVSFTNYCNYMADIDFGVKPYYELECECKNKIIVPISISPDYFMPKITTTNK